MTTTGAMTVPPGPELYHVLWMYAADLVAILDPGGTIRYASPSYERVLGYAPAALHGTSAFDLIHPDDRAAAAAAFDGAVRHDEPLAPATLRCRHADGTWRDVEVTGGAHLDDPVVRGVVVNGRDVTERKRAAKALRDELERRVEERTGALSRTNTALTREIDERKTTEEVLRGRETRLRLLVEQMPSILWSTDRRLRYVSSMGAGLTALGLGQNEIAGRSVGALFAAENVTATHTAAHRRALRGASVAYDIEWRGRLLQAYVEPLRDTTGRIVGVIGVAHDVTDRSLRRLQDEFLALASHELRTPLTPLQGYLELLASLARPGTPGAHYAAASLEQVGRLKVLVGDLLDVGRLQTGKLRIDKASLDLGPVVASAIVTARMEAPGQLIVLDADPAVVVDGDATRLEQVALNLLSNAVKYAPEGSRVEVRVEARDGWAEVRVSDDGPGIAAADLPHLFSRFYQGARADAPSRQGLGLGLFIARELVTAHGGTIGVTSEEGRGTTFTVRLPLFSG